MAEPVILFLCGGNACRSQMAEAFARKYGGDRFRVHSAGLEPKEIHPLTRRVLSEVGLDMAGQHAKSVDVYLGKLLVNYLLIVCDKAAGRCPTVWPGSPGMQRIVQPFDDPAAVEGTDEEKLAAFRRVRDEIDVWMREWMAAHEPAARDG